MCWILCWNTEPAHDSLIWLPSFPKQEADPEPLTPWDSRTLWPGYGRPSPAPSGRAAPPPHPRPPPTSTLHLCTWESSTDPSPWVWESWLHTSPEKNGPRGLYGQTRLTPQAHLLGLKLAHPTIYPTYDLQECLKELILGNRNHRTHRTSMTPDKSRISEKNVSVDPLLVVCQGQKSWTWLTTHYTTNVCKWSCLDQRYTAWYTAAPGATKIKRETVERRKDGRAKLFLL